MEIDHQGHAGRLGGGHDRLGIVDGGGERLLDQDVLAGLGAGDGDGAVRVVGRGDRNRVHGGIVENVVEVAS